MIKNDSVKRKAWLCAAIIAVLLVADQILKIWIKTHFAIGDEVNLIGDWCRLHFVENVGIAFGMSFGGVAGKYCLTLFRVVASAFIMYIIVKNIKKDSRYLLIVSLSLIFVGAVGNVIDSCFYGLIFSESTLSQVAVAFPEGGGYGRFLLGKVVDMFLFPLFEWDWPEWVPFVGGDHAEFFNAIFNIADSAICIGIVLLIIDQYFNSTEKDEKSKESTPISEENVDEINKNRDGEVEKQNNLNVVNE